MRLISVRYDEIALKGGKRVWYEKLLRKNLARQLGVPAGRIERTHGRMGLTLDEGEDLAPLLDGLGRTFGVAAADIGHVLPRAGTPEEDLAALEGFVGALARDALAAGKRTFKVETTRADKRFPGTSLQLSARLGGAALRAAPALKVDVHHPDVVISVEVRDERIFAATEAVPGPGGYPVSAGGSALCLLSGGIDSPVGAWYALKRGMHVDHIYFHAFPYTGDRALQKVLTLARGVSRWTPRTTRVFVVSTTRLQDAIATHPHEDLRVVLLRRGMYRLAREVLRARHYKALVTGESLGQVASQTPENLLCVEAVVPDTLVLRPLVGFDKKEIIAVARRIGTYETSILPYQDCCSLFAPKRPATHATVERCLEVERTLPLAELEAEALAGAEVHITTRGGPLARRPGGLSATDSDPDEPDDAPGPDDPIE